MTNTEILAAVSRAVNDATFAKRSKVIQLGILTDAQNYIIDKTECLRQVDSSLVLVTDTGTYSLPATFIKMPTVDSSVKRGLICLGTYGKFPLTAITLALLNNQYPNWRETSSGTPEFYVITEAGTPQLIIYPKPSSTFITTNGSTVFLDMIYRAAALTENTDLPFDNAARFNGLFQILLKLRAVWQIKLEDGQLGEFDRLEKEVGMLMEEAIDFVQSFAPAPGQHGFEESSA